MIPTLLAPDAHRISRPLVTMQWRNFDKIQIAILLAATAIHLLRRVTLFQRTHPKGGREMLEATEPRQTCRYGHQSGPFEVPHGYCRSY